MQAEHCLVHIHEAGTAHHTIFDPIHGVCKWCVHTEAHKAFIALLLASQIIRPHHPELATLARSSLGCMK